MSRRRTRARRRRAHTAASVAEFNRVRADGSSLAEYLKDRSAKDQPIWPVAEAASKERPLDQDERVMIQEAVALHLVRMRPGTVRRRIAIEQEEKSI